jgi:predicted dehydrogenase
VVPVMGPVTEVTAVVGAHDMTHVLLKHAAGGISTLTLSVDVPPAAAREEVVFAGEAGVITLPPQPWEPVEAFGYAVDDLLVAVAGARQPDLDVRLGARVTAILAAAAESAATGRTIHLS